VLRIFSPEKSDTFSRVWTRELGYQRPARYLQTTEAASTEFDYVSKTETACMEAMGLKLWDYRHRFCVWYNASQH
jgi:hypothetical protein